MAFIPEDKISEIRDRISIVSIISQYVHLKKSGVNYTALCPFHSEKTSSFIVSEAKRIYHCFGCGKGGNVFTFLMDHAGLSFQEAVIKLAGDLGISIPEPKSFPQQKELRDKKALLYKLNKVALAFFKEELKKNKKAQNFLKERGLSPETISRYHLGFAPDGWEGLSHYFKKKGSFEKHLIELGLIIQKDSRQRFYDRFRNRIIFPLISLSQRVLGFGGRALSDDEMPKYLNSVESQIYKKGEELYGLFQAIRGGGKNLNEGGIIIVEGYFDCLLLSQAGFKNVAATMGTALTKRHIDVLRRFTDRFYLAFDGDTAGAEATERSFTFFVEAGLVPKVIEFPPDKDPDDFIRTYSKEEFQNRIHSAQSLIDFSIHRKITRLGHSFSSKSKIIDELIPFLASIPKELDREEMVKKVSEGLSVDEKWVLKPLSDYLGANQQKGAWQKKLYQEYSSYELELIEFFILFPKWLEEVSEQKIVDLFGDLEVKELLLELMSQYQQNQTVNLPSLLDKMKSEELKSALLRGVLDKEGQNWENFQWRNAYEGSLKKLKRNHLEEVERELLREIKQCEEKEGLETEKIELLNRYQDVVRQKQSLNEGLS